MRLIDADALKDRIVSTCDLGGWIGDTLLEIKRLAIRYIDAVPTIEAVPVRKGKWLRDYKAIGMVWTCSECGRLEFGYEEYLSKFCDNCGADMRGEQDDYD